MANQCGWTGELTAKNIQKSKNTPEIIFEVFCLWEDDGDRTHYLQSHNLTL